MGGRLGTPADACARWSFGEPFGVPVVDLVDPVVLLRVLPLLPFRGGEEREVVAIRLSLCIRDRGSRENWSVQGNI